jgi:hypothetical protein
MYTINIEEQVRYTLEYILRTEIQKKSFLMLSLGSFKFHPEGYFGARLVCPKYGKSSIRFLEMQSFIFISLATIFLFLS